LEANGLEAVFLENRQRLLRFLHAHGAGEAAEDLLQQLWMKIAAAPSGPVAQPLAYLYRAANNLVLDRHRATRQASRRDQDWSDLNAGQAQDAPGEERALIARQQLAATAAALDALGVRAATVFRRYRIDGISQRDIAAALDISLSTVESDLRRAYAALASLQRTFDAV
jgi:RNA polymerase sigma factor (sigma-70 family)